MCYQHIKYKLHKLHYQTIKLSEIKLNFLKAYNKEAFFKTMEIISTKHLFQNFKAI